MRKRQFSDEERYAVYTVHAEKCYLCGVPVDLLSMEVDHVIPEALLDDPPKLAAVLAAYALPGNFDLQSFANWMPACGPCNNRKRSRVFDPTPRVQLELRIAAEKAPKAAALAAEVVSSQRLTRSWNAIKRAAAGGYLGEDIHAAIIEFVRQTAARREPAAAARPMRLTPLIEVVSESNGIRLVRGPYGVGGGPVGQDVHGSFRCSACGHTAWNGARCVVCGQMDDD
jgi:5-methylcytosine-specific restriction endonuclease McrA